MNVVIKDRDPKILLTLHHPFNKQNFQSHQIFPHHTIDRSNYVVVCFGMNLRLITYICIFMPPPTLFFFLLSQLLRSSLVKQRIKINNPCTIIYLFCFLSFSPPFSYDLFTGISLCLTHTHTDTRTLSEEKSWRRKDMGATLTYTSLRQRESRCTEQLNDGEWLVMCLSCLCIFTTW